MTLSPVGCIDCGGPKPQDMSKPRPTREIALLDARDALGKDAREGVDFTVRVVHGPPDRLGLHAPWFVWEPVGAALSTPKVTTPELERNKALISVAHIKASRQESA